MDWNIKAALLKTNYEQIQVIFHTFVLFMVKLRFVVTTSWTTLSINIYLLYNWLSGAMMTSVILQVSGRYVNDLGALCPVLERPEQGLDMLQEAFTHLELTAGEDFFIAINCAGHETFDHVSLALRVFGFGAQYLQVNVTGSSGNGPYILY